MSINIKFYRNLMKSSRMVVHKIAFIVGMILVTSSSSAQDVLQDYLEEAAENNSGLRQLFSSYQASAEKGAQVRGLPDPELSMGFFLMPMERYMGEQVADITIMQMFPWFGSLKAGEEEAALMAKMEFERFADIKNELFFNVKSAWYELYNKQQQVQLMEEELDLLLYLEQLALTNYSTGGAGSSGAGSSNPSPSPVRTERSGSGGSGGDGMQGMGNTAGAARVTGSAGNNMNSMNSMPASDNGMIAVLMIQNQMKALENDILLERRSMVPLKTQFNNLLNRDRNAAIILADTLTTTLPPESLNFLQEEATANNPMLKMYDWESQARVAQLDMTRRMGRPMLGIGLNYMVFRPRMTGAQEMGPMENGANMLMPMVTLSIPIYRKKYKAQEREVEYLQAAAVSGKTAAANELITLLDQAMYDYEASVSTLELLEAQIDITEQAISLMETNLSVGNTGMESLISQRQNLLNYKKQQIAQVVQQHISIAAIQRTIGY